MGCKDFMGLNDSGLKEFSVQICIRILSTIVVILCLLGIHGQAMAQTTGSIVGYVSDPSGAAVANAKVTAQSTEEGLTRTTTSNASGSYTLAQLPLGAYTVTAEAPGFERYVNTAVKVDADQECPGGYGVASRASRGAGYGKRRAATG